MFGFGPQTKRLEITGLPTATDFTLEMPHHGETAPVAATNPAKPSTTAQPVKPPTPISPNAGRGARGARGRQQAPAGRGGSGPNFQSVDVQATEQGREQAENAPPIEDPDIDASEAFLGQIQDERRNVVATSATSSRSSSIWTKPLNSRAAIFTTTPASPSVPDVTA